MTVFRELSVLSEQFCEQQSVSSDKVLGVITIQIDMPMGLAVSNEEMEV
ncbi:hypothetical protein L4D06_11050 [Enterovibrio makurazakiensis]|uniref:Uncharacterized protein n=1 Tax=Enterovibrio gelatinilyticus TaxID=2899819 RepID=A0ABT5QZB4_9GAMM|nr:hypothetical protein [Enterovibrio sp. ZSDZ42]MDD1793352.1 hypothetical protein [Enterovibrio sp. ZSDZ42]